MSETGAPFDFDLGQQVVESGWLYKERGVVCGPVSASVLIDKLFAGNLDGDTSISPEFGEWRPLREVAEFEGPLAKAQAALAAEKARRDEQRLRRHILLGRTGVVLFVAISFGSTGFLGGRYLATERPWEDRTDWVQRAPGVVALSVKPVVKATPTAAKTDGEVATTDENSAGDVLALATGNNRPAGTATPRKGSGTARPSKDTKPAKDDKKPAETGAAAGAQGGADDADGLKVASTGGAMEYNAAGLPRALTQNQIMKVLATQKPGIVACLAAEAKVNPDMPATVTIEFVITAEGTPSDFKVLERQVREGNLATCLRTKVMTLRWPKVFGENKTVKIPFNIKRK